MLVINWHLIGFIVLLIAVLFTALLAFTALSFSILRLFTRSKPPAEKAATSASPANNTDMEKLVDALAIRIRATPAINFPNHPAMSAVAEVIQKSARTEAALTKVVQAVHEANETATGSSTTV